MNLTTEHMCVLKGAVTTALLFSVGVAGGLFFLHRKHEAELDKLEKDTAMTCLDFAAEHYEGVLRRQKKETQAGLSRNSEIPDINSEAFQQEVDAMNNYEYPDEDWISMRKEADRHIGEYEALKEKIAKLDAECKEGLKKLSVKIYAEEDLIIKAHPEAGHPSPTAD